MNAYNMTKQKILETNKWDLRIDEWFAFTMEWK